MPLGSSGRWVVSAVTFDPHTLQGSRNMPGLSAATLASLGGTSSRRGSGDTSISIDTEASIREIKVRLCHDAEGPPVKVSLQLKDCL